MKALDRPLAQWDIRFIDIILSAVATIPRRDYANKEIPSMLMKVINNQ
jgi:hypothetical protein